MNEPVPEIDRRRETFKRLGLEPDRVTPLYAVPILTALRRVAVRHHTQPNPSTPSRERLTPTIFLRAAQAAALAHGEPHPDDMAVEMDGASAAFIERFLPDPTDAVPEPDLFQLAEQLLIRHLVDEPAPEARDHALDHLAAPGWLNGTCLETDAALERAADELREHVDRSLPRDVPHAIRLATVHLAKPFSTVTWEQTRAEVDRLTNLSLERVFATPLLFVSDVRQSPKVVIVSKLDEVPESLWFVGDLHGDPLAMENAWRFISEQSAREGVAPNVIFLGDFVDRGPSSHETLVRLFGLIVENPGRVGLVVGNHDENFVWDDRSGEFVAEMRPAEYAEQLNQWIHMDDDDSRARVRLGRFAAEYLSGCPRAIVLPDGTLIAHGGFPHTDLIESIQDVADLSRPECLTDFVWLRVNSTAPRKRPNRSNRGCEFGARDFARFCEHMHTLGVPISRMVRGHDHVSERFAAYERFVGNPILTLNTMCRRLPDELENAADLPLACVARYKPGELPDVYRLPIDPEQVRAAFPDDHF